MIASSNGYAMKDPATKASSNGYAVKDPTMKASSNEYAVKDPTMKASSNGYAVKDATKKNGVFKILVDKSAESNKKSYLTVAKTNVIEALTEYQSAL